MLRSFAAVVACLVIAAGTGVAASDQLAAPSPSSPMPSQRDEPFPTAEEVGRVLGVGVEASGVRTDLGQLWEHVELEPGAVTVARMQLYRALPAAGVDTAAGSVVEIIEFRSTADAATGGTAVATSITGSLSGFDAGVSADLIVGGSWTTVDGSGGSVILAQDGPIVIIVSVAGSDSSDTQVGGLALTRLVLERVRTGALSIGLDQSSAVESSPAADW